MFGEESAHYLGVGVERLKNTLLVVTALLTGAAVAVSGIIGFVGLITPHIARLLVGPDHRILLPVSVVTGAIFLVVADLASASSSHPESFPSEF
ncbi:MAG: iron chelate uptake ABC transporter family permease subunit [Methanomicrobiales archaeon]